MKSITYEQYKDVKKAVENGVSTSMVARLTGISESTVERIRNGTHKFDLERRQEPEKSTDLSEVTEGIESLKDEFHRYILQEEAAHEAIVDSLKQVVATLNTVNDNLKTIHSMAARYRSQIEGIREDFSDLTGKKIANEE